MAPEKKKINIHRLILAVLAVMLVVSGALYLKQYIEGKRTQSKYDKLAEMVQTTEEATAGEESKPEESESYISPIDFDKLREINPDIVGWITIDGTNIDYPILQTSDNDKYLHTDFEGNENIAGSIYLDFESDSDILGKNNVIYGHNMKNGTMFKDVVRYKSEDYFKEHQYLTIYTPETKIRLKAVSAYYGKAEPILRKTKFKTRESFNAFVDAVLSPCKYAEKLDVPVDSLYTLITCSYEIDDARTFLFAVPVDEDGNVIPAEDSSESTAAGTDDLPEESR